MKISYVLTTKEAIWLSLLAVMAVSFRWISELGQGQHRQLAVAVSSRTAPVADHCRFGCSGGDRVPSPTPLSLGCQHPLVPSKLRSIRIRGSYTRQNIREVKKKRKIRRDPQTSVSKNELQFSAIEWLIFNILVYEYDILKYL